MGVEVDEVLDRTDTEVERQIKVASGGFGFAQGVEEKFQELSSWENTYILGPAGLCGLHRCLLLPLLSPLYATIL